MGHSVNMLPVNWDVLRDATDNDKAAMKEIILIYLRTGVENVKELRSAVQREDPAQVASLAHRFLGSSRFLGATKIGIPLAALMKMGRTRRLSPSAAHLVDRTEKELVRIDHYVKTSHE